MAKAFSLASWNVEHFKYKNGNVDQKRRVDRVLSFLAAQQPDVVGLYEVEGKEVFDEITTQMPGYQFHITEGPQTQEILVGVRNGLTAFFTQKVEFRSGVPMLRPGALLTLRVDQDYSILFLHTKSGSLPLGLGIRDDQFLRAVSFRKSLDAKAGGKHKSNYIFLGDLNTMGMLYPYNRHIVPRTELRKLADEAKKHGMRRLTKNRPYTWWNGNGSRYPKADLDQVVASTNLSFTPAKGGKDVDVRGWPALKDSVEQTKWIKEYSDHGLLYFEVAQG